MSLTHTQIIDDAETRLIQALIANDVKSIRRLAHPEMVFTDESGQTYIGIEKIPYLNPSVLSLHGREIRSRNITFFTNIAVVNCVEKRTGAYLNILFEREFRINRVWKFNGRQWQLIAATLVLLPEVASEKQCFYK